MYIGLHVHAFLGKPNEKVDTAVWGHGVSDLAKNEAAMFMNEVIESLGQDNVDFFQGLDIQLHITPHDKKLTDLDQFSWLKSVKGSYDDSRGVSGTKFGSSILYAVGEETLVSIPGKSSHGRGFIVSHETGHIVEQFALTKTQRKRLQDAYNARKDANGPWLNPPSHTSSNLHEYFAQATAAFFGHPFTKRAADKEMYARAWLEKNDRPIYRLLVDVYKASAGRKVMGRE